MVKKLNTSFKVLLNVLLLLFIVTNISAFYISKYYDSLLKSEVKANAAVSVKNAELNIQSIIDIAKAQAKNYLYFFNQSNIADKSFSIRYINKYDVTELMGVENGSVYFNSNVKNYPPELNQINNILYYYSLENYTKFNNNLCIYYSIDDYLVLYPKIEIASLIEVGEELDFSEVIKASIKNVRDHQDKGIYKGYDVNLFPDEENLNMQVTVPVIKGDDIKGFLTTNFIISDLLELLSFDSKIAPYVSIDDYTLSYSNKKLYIYKNDLISSSYSKRFIKNNVINFEIDNTNDLPITISYVIKQRKTWILNFIIANTLLFLVSIFTYLILKQYNIKVKELEETKTEFLLTVSHEVKNPLMLISGYAKNATSYQDKESLKHSLSLIHNESSKLTNLINNILYYLRTNKQYIILLKEKILIDELFYEVVNLYVETKNITVDLEIEKDNMYLYGDREKLRRVLINLFMNSIEATSEGTITIYARYNNDKIIIGVKDTGIGISKEKQSQIFKVFYTNKKDGSGLGLSISKQIIDKHGGEIKVISEERKGSNFIITLPIE